MSLHHHSTSPHRDRSRPSRWMSSLLLLVGFAWLTLSGSASATEVGTRKEVVVKSLNPAPGVIQTFVSLYAPLPASVGAHPEACDWITYMRYRDAKGPSASSDADIVYTAQPGLRSGAMAYDTLARQVVQKAAAAGKHAEFWTTPRRTVCLVDRTGLDAAAAQRDYHVAVDYYYKGKIIDGKKFTGFLSGSQIGFLKHIDAVQIIKDWRLIMTEGLPDPKVRASKLICGGHSMGALITGMFIGWDFDGNPATNDDAGYKNCRAYFAHDSMVSTDPAALYQKPILGGIVGAIGNMLNTSAGAVLVDSELMPALNTGVVLTPETWFIYSIIGMAAYFEPDAESDLLRQLPHNLNLDMTLKVFLSNTYLQFVTGVPDVRSFRYTNAALLGALLDNNAQVVSLMGAGLGSFGGGPVAEKTFPIPSQIGDLPLVGPLLGPLLGTTTRKVGPINPFVLTTWRDYRQVPGRTWYGTNYTSPNDERVDFHDYARTMFEGPATHADAYVSMAMILDVLYLAGPQHGKFENLRYRDAATLRPRTIMAAEHSMTNMGFKMADPLLSILNPDDPIGLDDAVTFPGYNHLDMVGAAPIQNDGQPERVSTHLVQFGITNTSN